VQVGTCSFIGSDAQNHGAVVLSIVLVVVVVSQLELPPIIILIANTVSDYCNGGGADRAGGAKVDMARAKKRGATEIRTPDGVFKAPSALWALKQTTTLWRPCRQYHNS